LLRGQDKEAIDQETAFLPFLESLCKKNEQLNIYLLAWDFSVLFAMDREWFQDMIFNWTSSKRIHYRFDSSHAVGASHHQKFVIIDGYISFVGGLDISSGRWDDRRHLSSNSERVDANKKHYEPYHDMQALLTGPVSRQLVRLFQERWKKAGGDHLNLPEVKTKSDHLEVSSLLPLESSQVALSRTYARTIVPETEPIREIRNLYRDAILSAEKLVYIENQYFSSQVIFRALIDRMNDEKLPKTNIVLIIPKKPHAFVEEISLGLIQAKVLHILKETAKRTGHGLGIYYTLSGKGNDNDPVTYIHAKLVSVDDKFLTVGSANLTNRSMGLDTELNVSWEETDSNGNLARSIRDIRISLLVEHTGLRDKESNNKFQNITSLVSYLDSLAEGKLCRLRKHTTGTIFGNGESIARLDFDVDVLDPEKPLIEENVYELMSASKGSIFAQGITFLNETLSAESHKAVPRSIPDTARNILQFLRFHWILTILFVAIVITVLLFLF
jgi:phosphatidylserine/phosphatidylglycerophosphate/cardiolipin synthase-like enzyme